MPKFTIISPVYNTAEYLNRFIDSVLAQQFSDFELIIVDDGSIDDSVDICSSYIQKDKRIKLFQQHNQGAGPARNYGLSEATGEYILFYDSDDWLSESALQIINDTINNNSVDLLIYGAEEVRYNEQDIECDRVPLLPEKMDLKSTEDCRDVFCDLIFSSVLNVPWNKLYKKAIIDEHNIVFPSTRRAQDAFFNMEYYKHISSLYSIDNILYYYRGNTQEKVWKKFPKDLYKIDMQYDRYLVDIFSEFGIYKDESRELVDNLFYNSIFRTVGYCRNPKWKLSYFEKIEYISNIINEPYNVDRVNTAVASNKITQKIKERIVNSDAKGMLFDVYKSIVFNRLYSFYCVTLRRLIKGSK